MTKAFKALLLVCISIILASCSDEKIEAQLDGEWHGQCVTTDDDDDPMLLNMRTKLTKSSHKFSWEMVISIPDVGSIANVTFSGTWKADEEDLMLDVDANSVKVKFTNEFQILAQFSGMDVKAFERQMTQEFTDEVEGFSMMGIKRLSDSELVLDMGDGDVATFEKE